MVTNNPNKPQNYALGPDPVKNPKPDFRYEVIKANDIAIRAETEAKIRGHRRKRNAVLQCRSVSVAYRKHAKRKCREYIEAEIQEMEGRLKELYKESPYIYDTTQSHTVTIPKNQSRTVTIPKIREIY